MPYAVLLSIILVSASLSAAVFEPREFDSQAQRDTYRTLTAELRCLVCQNQNIADSDAPLAADLRDQVYEMLRAGKSEAEVTEYLVARYGDFVRYKPPLNIGTVALWVSPFVMVLVATLMLFRRIRGNESAAPLTALSKEEEQRLATLASPDNSEKSSENS